MNRGGLALQILATLMWLGVLAYPFALAIFRWESVYWPWVGLFGSAFIVSSLAWPVKKQDRWDEFLDGGDE